MIGHHLAQHPAHRRLTPGIFPVPSLYAPVASIPCPVPAVFLMRVVARRWTVGVQTAGVGGA
jgi:hypothetical protein